MKITAKWLEEVKFANGVIKYTAHCNVQTKVDTHNVTHAAEPYVIRHTCYGNRKNVLTKHQVKFKAKMFDNQAQAIQGLDEAIHELLGRRPISKKKIELPL